MYDMSTDEGVLTPEKMIEAFKIIENQPNPAPCGSAENRHLVSPSGLKRLSDGRQTCCYNCGQIVG